MSRIGGLLARREKLRAKAAGGDESGDADVAAETCDLVRSIARFSDGAGVSRTRPGGHLVTQLRATSPSRPPVCSRRSLTRLITTRAGPGG